MLPVPSANPLDVEPTSVFTSVVDSNEKFSVSALPLLGVATTVSVALPNPVAESERVFGALLVGDVTVMPDPLLAPLI